MSKIPRVLDIVVKNDLCIGCGLCVFKCPTKALEMDWNKHGFIIPTLKGNCDEMGACLKVCPFNPFPDADTQTENEIAELFLKDVTKHHKKIGKFHEIYAGYSNEFRLTSSSGGIATYIFTELLEKGIVDHVFCVNESAVPGIHYEYSISSSKEELLAGSKTKYFPVTLATVLPQIHELKGKIAIVGVACFVKAIRLAQHQEPELREKIPFLVGIICGGVKSRFFTEYLSNKASASLPDIQKPQYRIKDLNSTAGDYSFGCYDENSRNEKTIKMNLVGDMWGTGFFKANACDYCDDVTTELADISLGDAWLKPFDKDGRGTNVIVTRSIQADNLIQEGIKTGKLYIENLSPERFISSQGGNFNHRYDALPFRLNVALKKNLIIPPKRLINNEIPFDFKIVQFIRIITRKKSLIVWKKTQNAYQFEKKMKLNLFLLKIATKINHLVRKYRVKA